MASEEPVRSELSNKETAARIRLWCSETRSPFSWPTDGCGYVQHIRFVDHRNANWYGGTEEEFKVFALAYADKLEVTP